MITKKFPKIIVYFIAYIFMLLTFSISNVIADPLSVTENEEEIKNKTEAETTNEAEEPTDELTEPGDKESQEYQKERRRLLRELDPGLRGGEIIETPIGPKRYRIQLGLFSRFESDVFLDENDSNGGDVFRTTPSLDVEVDLIRKGDHVLTAKTEFEYNFITNTDNDENYFEFNADLEYEFGDNGIELKYRIAPDKFSTISDGNEIRKTEQEFDAAYARSLTRKLSFRTEYQLEYENQTVESRNNYENQFEGDVRYKFSDLFNPGLGFQIELRNSNRSNDERWGWAPFLLLNSKINDRVWSRFRYLWGSRNYTTEDIDDGNFNREDTSNEIRDNISIKLTRKWWLNIFAEYRQLDSSREGRDTNKFEIGMGIFYRFP